MEPHTLARMRKRFGAGATAAAVLTGCLLAVAPYAAAETAGSCSGSRTAVEQVKTKGGTLIGELVVYYQSAGGGTNTACLYRRGPAYGNKDWTSVTLAECFGTNCEAAFEDHKMTDEGEFSKYAGPVRRTSTDDNCVNAYFEMDFKGQRYRGYTGKVGCP